ncbi:MAG TPA: hypothetical protein VEM95_03285 [Thermoplasmata archaeon]|nr:hypothetical protein [Thermoplasmata archaeon]
MLEKGTSSSPHASPRGELSLLRPAWFVVWVSLGFGALVLVPADKPVYGALVPSWVWIIPFGEMGILFARTGVEVRRRGVRRHQWLTATIAGPVSAWGFAMGIIVLLDDALNALPWGVMGTASLLILAWWERDSVRSDVKGKPLRDFFPP